MRGPIAASRNIDTYDVLRGMAVQVSCIVFKDEGKRNGVLILFVIFKMKDALAHDAANPRHWKE